MLDDVEVICPMGSKEGLLMQPFQNVAVIAALCNFSFRQYNSITNPGLLLMSLQTLISFTACQFGKLFT